MGKNACLRSKIAFQLVILGKVPHHNGVADRMEKGSPDLFDSFFFKKHNIN